MISKKSTLYCFAVTITAVLSIGLINTEEHSTLCYYVSSTLGSNDNDGLSEKRPKKDLKGIPKKNVTIRLKCGDVFWGGIVGYENCIIENYGNGDRPVLCGFKILVNPNAWKHLEGDLWILDLGDNSFFGGNVVDYRYPPSVNDIGFIYDAFNDKVYGRNMRALNMLEEDMDFFTSQYFTLEDVRQHPFKTVIVKSSRNPSCYGNLCFPMYQRGVADMTNCKIRGLAVVGFSKMGMERLNGCEVSDCQIDLIGGGIQVGYDKRARFGNGIEIWYDCCDNIISNCLISRTYDCATTIQGNGDVKSPPSNNHFLNNKIYKCRQAFEHFINPSDGSLVLYDNCEFSNNVCFLMGDNEFNCPEMRDCNILSYENKTKSICIKGNTFFGSNHLDGGGIAEGMMNNIVYLYKDQYLYSLHYWEPEKNTIICESKDVIERYRGIAKGDNSRIVILRRGGIRARWIEKKIKRRVNWKPVNLHLDRILDEGITN